MPVPTPVPTPPPDPGPVDVPYDTPPTGNPIWSTVPDANGRASSRSRGGVLSAVTRSAVGGFCRGSQCHRVASDSLGMTNRTTFAGFHRLRHLRHRPIRSVGTPAAARRPASRLGKSTLDPAGFSTRRRHEQERHAKDMNHPRDRHRPLTVHRRGGSRGDSLARNPMLMTCHLIALGDASAWFRPVRPRSQASMRNRTASPARGAG